MAKAFATLDSLADQLAAISLGLDKDRAERAALSERIGSLELVHATVLQALTKQQMPLLETHTEMLQRLLEAATSEKGGGELANAITQLTHQVENLTDQDHELTRAVLAFPALVRESVILAAGGGIEIPGPDAEREPAGR